LTEIDLTIYLYIQAIKQKISLVCSCSSPYRLEKRAIVERNLYYQQSLRLFFWLMA